jgi:hypothetical protein
MSPPRGSCVLWTVPIERRRRHIRDRAIQSSQRTSPIHKPLDFSELILFLPIGAGSEPIRQPLKSEDAQSRVHLHCVQKPVLCEIIHQNKVLRISRDGRRMAGVRHGAGPVAVESWDISIANLSLAHVYCSAILSNYGLIRFKNFILQNSLDLCI